MSSRINDTSEYHRTAMESLGWELTVCNSLEGAENPCRKILTKDATFGTILYDFLSAYIPLDSIETLLEVGGGYGFIMRDFLEKKKFTAAMADISPYLLERQKETLKGKDVNFHLKDIFEADPEFLRSFECVLFNENIGDFPTMTDIDPAVIEGGPEVDAGLDEVIKLFERFALPVPGGPFNLNIGAIRALLLMAEADIPYIYMSEHSCESSPPDYLKGLISVEPTGNPRRIALKGHDEYTIKFSYLEKIGESLGYRVKRGIYTDILTFEMTDYLRFVLRSHSQKDEHEIIRHFIDDLCTYEYIIFMKD